MKRVLKKIRHFFRRIHFGVKGVSQRYYSSLISQHADFHYYLTLYKKTQSTDNIKTHIEICLSRSLKFGSSIKEVRARFRTPTLHLRNITSLHAEILLYKIMIGNHKVRCQLHFYEGKLFMYKYIFPYVESDKMDEIIQVIHEKYLPDVVSYQRQNIIDPYNNCLLVEDSIDLAINYLFLESDFFKKILNISQNQEQRIKKTETAYYHDIFNRI